VPSANVDMKSTSAPAFGLESSGTLTWVPSIGMLLRFAPSCEAEDVISTPQRSDAQWGRCPAVVGRDRSRKVDWTLRADFVASSVAASNSD
jgi:hypothetical protein